MPWPLNRSEAGGDLVLLQTFLLFISKSWYSHANKALNMIIYVWSLASIQRPGHWAHNCKIAYCLRVLLLRECAELITSSVGCILSLSITIGIFPEEWKCSKVIPLFKQGESSDLNNYRPISLIPLLAKVFERIVYDQFYMYLTEHNLISSKQSGFRSLHSTVTALLRDCWQLGF